MLLSMANGFSQRYSWPVKIMILVFDGWIGRQCLRNARLGFPKINGSCQTLHPGWNCFFYWTHIQTKTLIFDTFCLGFWYGLFVVQCRRSAVYLLAFQITNFLSQHIVLLGEVVCSRLIKYLFLQELNTSYLRRFVDGSYKSWQLGFNNGEFVRFFSGA